MPAVDRLQPIPSRPNLPPVFTCSLAFWAACAAAYASSVARLSEENASLALACAAVLAPSLALVGWHRTRAVAFLVSATLAGALLGFSHAAIVQGQAGRFLESGEVACEVSILEDSRNYGFGETAVVEVSESVVERAVFTAQFKDSGPLYMGQRFAVNAKVSELDYEKSKTAWAHGACAKLRVESLREQPGSFPLSALTSLRMKAVEAFDDGSSIGNTGAMLQALVCGYRRNIDGSSLYEAFQTCGLAHLIAVSGAHLVIVAGLFSSVLRSLKASRRVSAIFLVAIMASYYVLAGMPISALRATIMSSLGLLSYFGKRRSSSLNAIGISLFAMIAITPSSSISASLALSTLSTVGIVLFAPLAQCLLAKTPVGRLPAISDALSLTFASSILSQLYASSLFSQLPVVSPLANAITAPLFPIACSLGLASAFANALAPALGPPLTFAARIACDALSIAVCALADIPYASVPFAIGAVEAILLSGVVAFVLWALWPSEVRRFSRFAAAVLLILALPGLLHTTPSDAIIMLDVGQGDSILVKSGDRSLLIDTGNQDSRLLEQLAINRITHLDALLITHADDDHCGSLDALRSSVEVDRIIVADGILSCTGDSASRLCSEAAATARETIGVRIGDSFEIGAFKATVIWPRRLEDEGGNADSLCITLEYDGDGDGQTDYTALMTGDAEKDELREMLADRLTMPVDILKVSHHGSRNGMTTDEAQALNPKVALISCGKNNSYGHPTQEILDMLDKIGAQTFRTDEDGQVTCALSADRMVVSCSADGAL